MPCTICKSSKTTYCLIPLLLAFLIPHQHIKAQQVTVGAGSYTTSLPADVDPPQNVNGQNISPRIADGFNQPIQTNDFWSSLIFPFFGDAHSPTLYAHPILVDASNDGLQIGYTIDPVFAAQDYLYPFSAQLTVSVEGMDASETVPVNYTDWTVTAQWTDGSKQMEATFGHGLPFVYFDITGGNASIATTSTPTIWFNEGEVLGVTINGKHYGIFAPTGSTWSGTSTFTSDLNGKTYLSVALLPDNTEEILEYFRARAYAFVANSTIEWEYNEQTAQLESSYSYETTLRDSADGNLDETLTALYRHQWLHVNEATTSHIYYSPRGEMKLFEGNTFTTTLPFQGVLPALPNQGDYNPGILLELVQDVAEETLDVQPTYENGKAMARFANLVHIAEQLGATEERDYFLTQLKARLEEWFTAGGDQEYYYNEEWTVLTGYPSGFGADREINDHHFHASYAVASAATIANYDSAWASQDQWGGMVNLLIKDANNWDRTDDMFPFLRSHDIYAGHSWAAGHAAFGDGNNQESSSESMNFASAVVLWGEATNQDEIRDLGVFLYATETTAVEQYWFDVDEEVFPEDYGHVAIGMVWGGKGVHSTWFGADPEFIHGINLLPITSGSLYLGRHPDYILKNYNEVVEERSGQPTVWKDIFWQYLALSDANQALSYYFADPNYEPFDGESRAHTMHWLYNMKKMGQVDTTTFADIPTYAVFKSGDDKTYIAYNAGSAERVVNFTDGYSMSVPSRTMSSETTAETNPDAPVAILIADKTSGKSPLTIQFAGSNSFDRNDLEISYSWEFDSLGVSSASDTSFTFTEVGEYLVKLEITNSSGFTASDSVRVEVLPNGTPFGGEPIAVPGKIEAEDYDLGGEGIAYHDTEASNIGIAYRPEEGVDLTGANDGGFAVYWIVAGEWIEYTFEVEEAGAYTFSPYVTSVPGFGNFRMYIDNVDVSGRRNVTSTGGWESWTPIDIEGIELEAGIHRMRFEFDSDTDKEGWLFSMNYIDVQKTTAVGIEDEGSTPGEFSLSQNYPNPFNPSTKISFALPKTGHTQLRVFNVTGQLVQQLVDQTMNQGQHSLTFDASALSSGVYFYQLEFDGQVLSNKMVLLK
ncbi:MAG: carbohydrate-binding protein [Balneola sp.]|nr:MAG: carbohydrate-binding protein [Balneola sp.]